MAYSSKRFEPIGQVIHALREKVPFGPPDPPLRLGVSMAISLRALFFYVFTFFF